MTKVSYDFTSLAFSNFSGHLTEAKLDALKDFQNTMTDEELNEVLELDVDDIFSTIFKNDRFYNIYMSKISEVDYPFVENRGICGILLSNGKFMKCYEYEHSSRVDKFDKSELDFAIYFSSKMNFDGKGGLSFDTNNKERYITASQEQWIKEHYIYMDKDQKWMTNVYSDKAYVD